MKVVKNNDFQNIEMYRRIENKLPSDWCVESIRNICDLQNGMAFKPDDKNDQGIGLPVVRIQNLNGSDKYDYYNKEVKKQFLIKNGDVLFAWSATLGGYLWRGGDAILNQHIFNVIPKDFTNKTWLYYLFNTIIKSRAYNDAHGGGGMVHVKKGVVQDYLIPFPPKGEQEKIANFLSERESYLQSIQTLISKMEQRNQYYLNLYFKDIEDGDEVSVSDLGTITTGNTPKKTDEDNYSEDGYLWVNVNDMKGTKYVTTSKKQLSEKGFSKSKVIKKDSILFSCLGTIGKVAINKKDVSINQAINAITPNNNYDVEYIYYLMLANKEKILRKSERNIIPIINKSNFSGVKLFTHDSKEKQYEVANTLNNLWEELRLTKELYSKEKQVFQWLCEKLVSGEYKIEI